MRRAALTGALALATVGCGLLAGLKLPDLVDVDAAPSVPGDAAVAETLLPPCEPKLPAPPGDQGGAEGPRVTFAIEYVASGTVREDAGLLPGGGEASRLCVDPSIDLDGLNTCDSEGGIVTGGSCKGLGPLKCDRKGGGDNAAATLIALYQNGPALDPQDDPNPALRAGRGGILLDLSAYNGKDDDSAVGVALLFAAGVRDIDGGLGAVPRWDGTDVWVAEQRAFIDTEALRYVAREAYVAGGLLVARFENTPFNLGGSGSRLNAREFVVSARVIRKESGEAVRLDKGRIGVRIAIETILDYAGGRLLSGKSLCDPTGNRANLLTTACGLADLSTNLTSPDANAPCDAISYALGFYGVAAMRAPRPAAFDYDGGAPRACEFPPWPVACP